MRNAKLLQKVVVVCERERQRRKKGKENNWEMYKSGGERDPVPRNMGCKKNTRRLCRKLSTRRNSGLSNIFLSKALVSLLYVCICHDYLLETSLLCMYGGVVSCFMIMESFPPSVTDIRLGYPPLTSPHAARLCPIGISKGWLKNEERVLEAL